MSQQTFHQFPPEAFVLVLVIGSVAFWCFLSFLLAFVSGWRRLAHSFGSDRPPSGKAFTWQTGIVGVVSYNRCLNIHVAREGLFLSAASLFRVGHKPLLIPWTAISNEEPTQILWANLTRFQVGTPSIASLRLPTEILNARPAGA